MNLLVVAFTDSRIDSSLCNDARYKVELVESPQSAASRQRESTRVGKLTNRLMHAPTRAIQDAAKSEAMS